MLSKVLLTAAATVAATALSLGAAVGLSYAADAPPTTAPATASTTPTASTDAPATATATMTVRVHMTNVKVTFNDGKTLTVVGIDQPSVGGTWTAAKSVKVNLRGGKGSLRDVLVGMRVHVAGTSTAGVLTVDHVVVPNTPGNRALQAKAKAAKAKAAKAKAKPAKGKKH